MSHYLSIDDILDKFFSKGYEIFLESDEMIFMGKLTPIRMDVVQVYKKDVYYEIINLPREVYEGLKQMEG